MKVAVIDKVLPAIDVANCGQQVLAGVGMGHSVADVDKVANVGALLPLEAGAGVHDFFMTVVKHG